MVTHPGFFLRLFHETRCETHQGAIFSVVLLEATKVVLLCIHANSVLVVMVTTMAMARALLAHQTAPLCLGGTNVPSKRHLSLSDKFSA